MCNIVHTCIKKYTVAVLYSCKFCTARVFLFLADHEAIQFTNILKIRRYLCADEAKGLLVPYVRTAVRRGELFLDRLGARAVRHSRPRARSRKRAGRPLLRAAARAASWAARSWPAPGRRCGPSATQSGAVAAQNWSAKNEPKYKKYRLCTRLLGNH